MKIAVSATGADLSAQVDPRFGRCQYFIIVDPETMQFEALENPNVMAGGGAGISTAQMIANKGVEVVLTGNCGPNAYQTLSASGVQVITGVTGTVQQAIEGYKAGRFQATSQPSVGAHFATGIGPGTGIGRGMVMSPGMGMGRGMGRGTSRGMGMGMGAGIMPMAPPAQPISREEEIEALKTQTHMMGQQLSQIQRRIGELEKKGK
jgi:predicted Fe-Mo cluster-binding NifX family protein